MKHRASSGLVSVLSTCALLALALAGCSRSRCCPCPRTPAKAKPVASDVAPPAESATPEADAPAITEATPPTPVEATPSTTWQALVEAEADLKMLQRTVKKKTSINADIQAYVTVVADAYAKLTIPTTATPDEAARFKKDLARFRKTARKYMLASLTLVVVRDGRNIRDDVNYTAALSLGRLAPVLDERERKRLSKDIRNRIEKKFHKVKTHTMSEDVLLQSFTALARLDDVDSLEWMLDDYVHAKQNQVTYLVAAHKAMPVFDDVPGKLRHEIVGEFIKTYAGVEARAAQSSTDPKIQAFGRFWDRVGPTAIAVVQHFADHPQDANGRPLDTMAAFQRWLRNHKNRRKAPWTDDAK